MIYFIISSVINTVGWTFYLTKESVMLVYRTIQNRKKERRLLMIEDKMKEQNALIYNLQFDLEEKNNPESTHGFELLNVPK
jgi:hypothetical protein